MAVVLADGDVTHAHFSNPNDPRLAMLMRRVKIEFHDRLGLPDNELIIETQDGGQIEPCGGREFLPMLDVAAILAKYAQQHIGAPKMHELPRRVARLDKLPDVRALTQCLA